MNNDEDKTGNKLLRALAATGGLRMPTKSSAFGAGGFAASAGLLGGVLNRPEVTGLYFNGKVVLLDGYKFVGCRFDNCTFQVSTTNFELIRCVIDPSCAVTYKGHIMKVLQLFNGRYDWAYDFFAKEFLPIRNADGSITISDQTP